MGKFDKHDKKGEKDKKSTKVDERTEGCKKLLTVDYAASEPEFGIKAMKWCLAYEAMKSGKAPVFVREQVQVQAETRVMHPDDVERVELRAWTADDTREMNRRNAEVTKDEAAWKKESNAMCRLIERHLSSNVKEEMKARLSYNECLRQQDCVGLWELYRAVTEQMIKHYAEQWKAELRYHALTPERAPSRNSIIAW
jgi:tRNA nucleotidyltransferase/poly(A) polymerase